MEASTNAFLRPSRRAFLAGAAGLAVATLAPRRLLAAGMAGQSFAVGDFEVTVISDGNLELPLTLHAVGAPEEQRKAVFAAAGMTGEKTQPAVNLTLVKRGSDVILFDAGCGPNMAPTVGKMRDSLDAAGIDPAAVTKVVISHGHPDHVFGLLAADGSLAFPNASYYAGAEEWDFWMADDLLSKLPEGMHQMANAVRKHLGAVKERVTMVRPGGEVVTGIAVIDTRGHTPGHLSFRLAGGEGLVIVADAITNSVYFPHPEWKFGFDAIHEQAVKSRQTLLDMAAADKVPMLGYHWAFPGLARAERRGTGYAYAPV